MSCFGLVSVAGARGSRIALVPRRGGAAEKGSRCWRLVPDVAGCCCSVQPRDQLDGDLAVGWRVRAPVCLLTLGRVHGSLWDASWGAPWDLVVPGAGVSCDLEVGSQRRGGRIKT